MKSFTLPAHLNTDKLNHWAELIDSILSRMETAKVSSRAQSKAKEETDAFANIPPSRSAAADGLSVTEAARLLGWNKSKVTRWCNAGKLEAEGKGRDRRISEASVTSLMLAEDSEMEVKKRLQRLRE